MTLNEFDKTQFKRGLRAIYDGRMYRVGAVNFSERLIGLRELDGPIDEEPNWCRCENVTLAGYRPAVRGE